VLERKLDEAWRASLTLAFQQEEARLADLAGQRQDYESERVAALFGLRRTADGRFDILAVSASDCSFLSECGGRCQGNGQRNSDLFHVQSPIPLWQPLSSILPDIKKA
jgi:hypothetical protein